MPNYLEPQCVCERFSARYGAELAWTTHLALCPDVAPWIRAWAAKKVAARDQAVLESATSKEGGPLFDAP